MIIAGNSHVALFRNRLRYGADGLPIGVKWVGALTANHFIHNHSAGRTVRNLFQSSNSWKFLSIGMHDVFGLCHAYSQNRYPLAFDQLQKHYQCLFSEFNRSGKFGWLISPQQLDGPGVFGLSEDTVYNIANEFNHALTTWCNKKNICVINPLASILNGNKRLRKDMVQKDGIHLSDTALPFYVSQIAELSGERIQTVPRPNLPITRLQAASEPESLALLIADELNLDWDSTRLTFGKRKSFEDKILQYIGEHRTKLGLNADIDRFFNFNKEGALSSTSLVDIYNFASDLVGNTIDFDVNIRQLDCVAKLSRFFIARKPLTKNDFVATLAADDEDQLRMSEVMLADSKIAGIDDDQYAALKEIVHLQTGGSPSQYGIIYFWYALAESKRGNFAFAMDLLNYARSPHLNFPFRSNRTCQYEQTWHAQLSATQNSPNAFAEEMAKSQIPIRHYLRCEDLISAWYDQTSNDRLKVKNIYVVSDDDNVNFYIEQFPDIDQIHLFVPSSDAYQRLERKFRHKKGISIRPFILSDRSGYEIAKCTEWKGLNLVHFENDHPEGQGRIISTETIAAEDYLRQQGKAGPDLLICTLPGLTERICNNIPGDIASNINAILTIANSPQCELDVASMAKGDNTNSNVLFPFGTSIPDKDVDYTFVLYINQEAADGYLRRIDRLNDFISKSANAYRLDSDFNALPDGIDEELQALVESSYDHGIALVDSQLDQDALFAFKRTTEMDPQHARALFQIGKLYCRHRKWSDAIPYLKSAFMLAPTDAQNAQTLVDALCKLGHRKEAAAISQRYTALNMNSASPGETILLPTKQLPQCHQEPEVEGQLQKIYRLVELGKEADAFAALEALLIDHPDAAQAHNDMGVMAFKRKDHAKALKHYRHAVELAPQNSVFQKNLADYLYFVKGDTQSALGIYTALLATDPNDTEALSAIGHISFDIGQENDALTFFQRILELEPENSEAKEILSRSLHKSSANAKDPNHLPEPAGLNQNRKQVRVSAIVSTYAARRFIRGRLQNLVDQTLFKKGELEIIVVDSNSPEDERSVVEEFSSAHSHVYYLRTGERETVYTAWNRGLDAARGTYFVNANTDDRFSPDALELMADTLDANPEYDAAYGNWVVTRTPNDQFESVTPKRLFEYPEFFPGLFFYLQITTHANFVRRSVFDGIGGFDGSYTVFGDREFMFRFAAAGHQALKLDAIIGLYLENPTSVERANKEIGRQECTQLYRHYLSRDHFAAIMGVDSKVPDQRLAREYTRVGCLGMGLYRANGKAIHALGSPLQLFSEAIRLHPDNAIALNNIGIITQHLEGTSLAIEFFDKACACADKAQARIIERNRKLARRNITDANQLRFLFPSDFKPIHVHQQPFVFKKHYRSAPVSETQGRSSVSPPLPPIDADIRRLYLTENYSELMPLLASILSNQPDHWEAYALLVDVMMQSGQAGDIPTRLRLLEARTDAPAWVVALIGSGYEAAGQLNRATDFADRALALDGHCARAWNLKGVIAFRRGHRDEALAHFQKAAENDADWGDPLTNRGTVFWDQEDVKKALACLEKGFQLSPTAPNVAATYHMAISEAGLQERARPLFESAVAQHPDFRRVHFLLIDILIRLESYRDAMDRIESALVRFGPDAQFLEAAVAVRNKVGPMTVPTGEHPTLSLCMIVKNEEQYLPRCLESLKPIVDEMIIVDTGSTDATRDIATVFGAKVFDFKWQDDFAAARNHSLEQAAGDWILIMDADEVIAPRDHSKLVQILQPAPTDAPAAFLMTTRNYTDRKDSDDFSNNCGDYPEEKGRGWAPSKKVRLFRNHLGIHFVYPVHEQVDPVLMEKKIAMTPCQVPVHHFGKLDDERSAQRLRLYYDLGRKKLHMLGDNEMALKELAIQAALLAKWDESATYWHRYLQLVPGSLKAHMHLTRVMAEMKDFQQAHRHALTAVQLSDDKPDQLFNLALTEIQIGQAEKAVASCCRLMEQFPNDLDGKLLHAVALMCTGKQNKAISAITGLLPLTPNDSLISRLVSIVNSIQAAGHDRLATRIVDAVTTIDRLQNIRSIMKPLDTNRNDAPALSSQHHGSLSTLLNKACQASHQDDFETALNALTKIFAIAPDHWEAYALLVDVMMQSGQAGDIPTRLRPLEARTDAPAWVVALVGCGYEAAGQLTPAADFADRALALDGHCARAWNLKGVIAFRHGHRNEALEHFQRAAENDADWGDPWTNMGTVHWEQNDLEKAVDCFEKGFALSPTAPNVAGIYHIAISETGQYKRACALFDQTIARQPDFRKAYFLSIDILIQLESYQDALERIESALVRFGPDAQFLTAAVAVRDKVGPMTVQTGKHPTLSLCMIVKNEEQYLPRCLESLKPIVDEMIIVDTGSTDATRDIATVFGAKVFDFKWQDDFAAARNHSLEQAAGDWILIMDADEVIAPRDHASLQSLVRRYNQDKVAFLITTRNYTHSCNGIDWMANDGDYRKVEAGHGWIPSTKTRLFKNRADIRFEYPVHELVDPALERHGFAIQSCQVPVHHYGFLDRKNVDQKGQQYHSIGMKKLKELKNDPKAIRELAVQAGLLNNQEEALQLWRKLAKLEPRNAKVYINISALQGKLGNYSDARDAARKAIEHAPQSREGHLNLGRSMFFMGDFAEATKVFKKITRIENRYYPAIFMLGAAQICLGHTEKGMQTIKKLQRLSLWNSLSHAFQELAVTLDKAGFKTNAQNLIACAAQIDVPQSAIPLKKKTTWKDEPTPLDRLLKVS